MMILRRILLLAHSVVFAVLLLPRAAVVRSDEQELESLMTKMEGDAIRYAAEMERAYADRCSSATLNGCSESHHHESFSDFPNGECRGGSVYGRSDCAVAKGSSCSVYDFSVSNVRLSPHVSTDADGHPTEAEVKETMCYSKRADDYAIETFASDAPYWENLGVEGPSQMFFGSDGGAFRIYPARPSAVPGQYDATRRPWYVAATSGPKDVILILDASGSMLKNGRLALMQEAARRVIDTLTVGDHVGVVAFSGEAGFVARDYMVQATNEQKASLRRAIDEVEAQGATNFVDAFDKAFDMMDRSKRMEFTSGCHTAVLFLSDGEMSAPDGATADDVIDLIRRREQEVGVEPRIFMYGLGSNAQYGRAAEDPKAIACATGGMYSFLEDGGDLASAMANYYKLFALGLGEDANEGFAAWVDPYEFATGGVLGTTVSAPVYDRTVVPHVLVGAVGYDFTMSAMDRALGVEAGSRETLQKLVRRSTAVCPDLTLTNCELQSLRLEAGGDAALCPDECEEFVGIRPEVCSTQSDLPSRFWANLDAKGRTFVERACCTDDGSGTCAADDGDDGAPFEGLSPSPTPTTTTEAPTEALPDPTTLSVGLIAVITLVAFCIIVACASCWCTVMCKAMESSR